MHGPPLTDADPLADPEVRRRFDEELQRAKLDAMKELAYGASHEINNPLANIALRAQTLLKREDDADKRKALEAIHRAAMRAHEMISDLMLFARPPRLRVIDTDLRDVAFAAIADLQRVADDQGVELTSDVPEAPLVADVDAEQLTVAVRALVQNGLDALSNGGRVRVVVRAADEAAFIEVIDNGPGVPADVAPHVFDPFFSGREAGRGLGFGLSKAWRIATDHGGDLRLESPAVGGVRAVLTLPSSDHASRSDA